ncbi:MAG: DegV family protein, partial [Clostridiales bacterium]|nr:DegV family protein [Clostridiales bacterium]
MSKFIVTTDSGCDLPYSLLQKREIIPIPIRYEIDGKEYDDTMLHEDCVKFYEAMRDGATPKTSQINVMRFVKFWLDIAEKRIPIIHISL